MGCKSFGTGLTDALLRPAVSCCGGLCQRARPRPCYSASQRTDLRGLASLLLDHHGNPITIHARLAGLTGVDRHAAMGAHQSEIFHALMIIKAIVGHWLGGSVIIASIPLHPLHRTMQPIIAQR